MKVAVDVDGLRPGVVHRLRRGARCAGSRAPPAAGASNTREALSPSRPPQASTGTGRRPADLIAPLATVSIPLRFVSAQQG